MIPELGQFALVLALGLSLVQASLPLIGAVPTGERPPEARQAADLPRHRGLYAVSGFGARGLVWSSLAGEMLASLLDTDALPLERDIVDALDCGRFLLRPQRSERRNRR